MLSPVSITFPASTSYAGPARALLPPPPLPPFRLPHFAVGSIGALFAASRVAATTKDLVLWPAGRPIHPPYRRRSAATVIVKSVSHRLTSESWIRILPAVCSAACLPSPHFFPSFPPCHRCRLPRSRCCCVRLRKTSPPRRRGERRLTKLTTECGVSGCERVRRRVLWTRRPGRRSLPCRRRRRTDGGYHGAVGQTVEAEPQRRDERLQVENDLGVVYDDEDDDDRPRRHLADVCGGSED